MKEHLENIVKSRKTILAMQERKLDRCQRLKEKGAISDEEIDNQTILTEVARIDLTLALIALDNTPEPPILPHAI